MKKRFRLRESHRWSLILLPAIAVLSFSAAAQTPLQQHMQHMLSDGDRWVTPNPGYEPGSDGPEAFGLTLMLAPDGSHVTGSLSGIHPDGRQAVYWSLLAFYNPVTERVVTQQVGWDGTLLRGEVPVQPGTVQIVDMIHYNADGSLGWSRHQNRFEGSDRHASAVLEHDGNGQLRQRASWEWRRQPILDAEDTSEVRASPDASLADELSEHMGFRLAGSGRWRSPNPDYVQGGDASQYFGMNFRPGPHGRHVVGEITSIFADGREEREWTLYVTWNPVTQTVWMEQTGASGVYFRGELDRLDIGRYVDSGIVYLPNGQAKSVRDEIEIIDASSFVSHVFERDAAGRWEKAREWVWTLQPNR